MIFTRKTEKTADVDAARDEQLAVLLSQIADQVQPGPGTQSYRDHPTEHPEFERDLRELWGTVMLANAVGGQSLAPTEPFDSTELQRIGLDLPARFGDYELLRGTGARRHGHRLSRAADQFEPRSRRQDAAQGTTGVDVG